MKKIFSILLILSLVSCNQDCLEKQGDIISQEIALANFNEIIAGSGVQVRIKEAAVQKVVLEVGENRIEDVHFDVQDAVLSIEADALCMLAGTYEPAIIKIESPAIRCIRNASEYTISSEGVLTYPELTLLVEDDESQYLNVGDFDLQLNNLQTTVISNGIANVHLTGETNHLQVSYFNGIGRFEGADFIAQEVGVFHRSENVIRVNPQQSLAGDLYSVGDLISYNHPPVVNVTEHYQGRLRFY